MFKGAQVFQENDQGEIALHLACKEGNIETSRVLLEAGSDPNALTL